MTGTDLCVNLATSVPVIFEPPCTIFNIILRYLAHCDASDQVCILFWSLCASCTLFFTVIVCSILQFKVLLIKFRPPLQDLLFVAYYVTFLNYNQQYLWIEIFFCTIHFFIKFFCFLFLSLFFFLNILCAKVKVKAWSGPEGSRKLRLPDFMTTAQVGGKVVSHMHRPPLPPGNAPSTQFC